MSGVATSGLLLGLDALPGAAGQKRIPEACILEHMGMPPDHLGGDGIDHVTEAEASVFLSHAGVIDDLQQEIAELVLEPVEIVPCDGVGDLVSFLDRVWRDRREALLAIPRATHVGVAQPRHHPQKIADRVGTRRALSHETELMKRRRARRTHARFP
jgi:hypothetical protein